MTSTKFWGFARVMWIWKFWCEKGENLDHPITNFYQPKKNNDKLHFTKSIEILMKWIWKSGNIKWKPQINLMSKKKLHWIKSFRISINFFLSLVNLPQHKIIKEKTLENNIKILCSSCLKKKRLVKETATLLNLLCDQQFLLAFSRAQRNFGESM